MVVKTTPKKLVGYYRVSTQRQGKSGLGLEAQRAAAQAYAKSQGGTICREFVEVESGKRHENRPELAKAIDHSQRCGCTLVIAKLDRLARNVHFVSGLMESGVDFVACDNPHANRLTIHILAAVAEDEAKRISDRTKAALEAYKERGGVLGSARPGHWEGQETARRKGAKKGNARSAEVRQAQAKEKDALQAEEAKRLKEEGLSLREIAARMNAEGCRTRRGKELTAMSVKRLLSQ